MKIEQLSPEVIGQIAAGEVLERPANLVKELVENSIDAGANDIEVDLSEGGRWVRVKDNGSGIDPEDLPMTVARHATSKLQKSSDLWSLSTFGFRGEALASISAVSHMEIVSKRSQNPSAYRIRSHFGVKETVEPIGGEEGTQILVQDLFANLPARLKFLKSDASEIQQIKKVLKALALAHPEVSFRTRVDQKIAFHYPKTEDFARRISDVLDLEKVFVAKGQMGELSVQIGFASPDFVARNSQNIWCFVQNRWVQDRGIQAAVQESYRGLLMHGEFPFACVALNCSPQLVDVNVHPAKAQVKFQDASQVFRLIHTTLRTGLEKAPWTPNSARSIERPIERPIELTPTAPQSRENFETKFRSFQSIASSMETASIESEPTNFVRSPQINYELKTQELKSPQPDHSHRPAPASEPLPSNLYWQSLKVLGQCHNTYILTQSNDALILIDQHAAHERVVFERLWRSWTTNQFEVQNFLLPLILNLSLDEIESLQAQSEALCQMGFRWERTGDQSLSIQSAPALLKDTAIVNTLAKVAHDCVNFGGSLATETSVTDLLATAACHSVVRAGMKMSTLECESLLKQMDEFPLSGYCPHGRPVSVEYQISRIERDFGRIN